jgi:hypothetical protein
LKAPSTLNRGFGFLPQEIDFIQNMEDVMSVIVIGSPRRFPSMLRKLSQMDIGQVHFYATSQKPVPPLVSLLPFVDLIVFENDWPPLSEDWSPVLKEAERLNVSLFSESMLESAMEL